MEDSFWAIVAILVTGFGVISQQLHEGVRLLREIKGELAKGNLDRFGR